jgi:hypothetical protein
MKNLLKLTLVSVFIFAASYCFSQEQKDPKKTELSKSSTTVEKSKKSASPSSRVKAKGISNKIAVSDHGIPAEKSNTKKAVDKDKAVVPKKSK